MIDLKFTRAEFGLLGVQCAWEVFLAIGRSPTIVQKG